MDKDLEGLGRFLQGLPQTDALLLCLALSSINQVPIPFRPVLEQLVLVAIDCEHWSDNTDELTEVGFATLERRHAAEVVMTGNLGDHGANVLQRIRFNFLRLIENAHLPWATGPLIHKGNPDLNRFGLGRFVGLEDLRRIFNRHFSQTTLVERIGDRTDYRPRPIVVLGHAVGNDVQNLKSKVSAVDLTSYPQIVLFLDTQVIAREIGIGARLPIGLPALVSSLGFTHTDPHTAANDAGRTMIAAIQLGLSQAIQEGLLNAACKNGATSTMQQVADAIEQHSKKNHQSLGGVATYCWRCGSSTHMGSHWNPIGACDKAPLAVYCTICQANTHIHKHCTVRAAEKAAERKKRHAEIRAAKEQAREEERQKRLQLRVLRERLRGRGSRFPLESDRPQKPPRSQSEDRPPRRPSINPPRGPSSNPRAGRGRGRGGSRSTSRHASTILQTPSENWNRGRGRDRAGNSGQGQYGDE